MVIYYLRENYNKTEVSDMEGLNIRLTNITEDEKYYIKETLKDLISITKERFDKWNEKNKIKYDDETLIQLTTHDKILINELMIHRNEQEKIFAYIRSLQYWVPHALIREIVSACTNQSSTLMGKIVSMQRPQCLYRTNNEMNLYHYQYRLSDLFIDYDKMTDRVMITTKRTKEKFIPDFLSNDPELELAYLGLYKKEMQQNQMINAIVKQFYHMKTSNQSKDHFEFEGISFDSIFLVLYQNGTLIKKDYTIDFVLASNRLISRSGHQINK